MQAEARQRLATSFEEFARKCADREAPFYERLSSFVAGNDALLEIASSASREPATNVFFGAVHYLLLAGAQHELREYYPSLTRPPRANADVFDTLVDFCAQFRNELTPLINSRLVQTNEVNRCAILAPVFSVVYGAAGRQRLAMVEVGASAGLNLIWDRYRICYSDDAVLGDPQSALQISCENRGAPFAPELCVRPAIASRVGVDFHPIDLHDERERLWLRALVWPDHHDRAARLETAMALAMQAAPQVAPGDACTVLPNLLANVPRHLTLCVYHSSVLYQFTPLEREKFAALLAAASAERPIWQVAAENEEGLWLYEFREGRKASSRLLGEFDGHGRWLRWQE